MKDIMTMSKIELQEYAKRARYMLGKNYAEKLALERELTELQGDLKQLKEQLRKMKEGK